MCFSTETEIYDDIPLPLLLKMQFLSNEKMAAQKLANQLQEENERLKSELASKERHRKLFFDLYQNVVQFVPQLAVQYSHFEAEVTEEFYVQNIQTQIDQKSNKIAKIIKDNNENQTETLLNSTRDPHTALKETNVKKKRPIAIARRRHQRIQPKYFKCKSADGISELEVTINTTLSNSLISK